MIETKIWQPNQDNQLDSLFNELRQKQFQDTTHPLYQNYNKESFKECSAFSITFDNEKPICCASILRKSFWPEGAYRILNRFWKVTDERFEVLNRNNRMLRISDSVKSQLEYAQLNLNPKLLFISRQEEHWQQFFIETLENNTGYKWVSDLQYHYQTCLTPNDQSCWQRIIFYGDSSVLESWNRR